MQKTEREIIDRVLDIFSEISAIPRKSGHEQDISRYLFEKTEAMGLKVAVDTYGNVIVEKAAVSGCEDMPTVILQAHMDMVCVAEENVTYDPLRDPIKLKIESNFLSAEGTSLGADDGIGVAAILYLLGEDFPHGPLRAIFTVDEEVGMHGAKNLEEKHLQGDYLINCDSEDVDLLTVSSAGSISFDFKRSFTCETCRHEKALQLSVKGLLGGHSGVEIHCGRANAVCVMGMLLDRINAAGIDFSINTMQGGSAYNAIPAAATAVIGVEEGDISSIVCIVDEVNMYLKRVYGNVEKKAVMEWTEVPVPAKAMDAKSKNALIQLLCLFHSGIYAMTPTGNMVESSANLGEIRTSSEEITLLVMARSALDDVLENFRRSAEHLAETSQFKLSISSLSPGWPEKSGSKLTLALQDAFEKITGRFIQTERIHAGLECSWFHKKNPKLDMVSIGPTITNIHSPQEKLHIDTLPVHVNLIREVLQKLDKKMP